MTLAVSRLDFDLKSAARNSCHYPQTRPASSPMQAHIGEPRPAEAGRARFYGADALMAETPRPGVRACSHPGSANLDVDAPLRNEIRRTPLRAARRSWRTYLISTVAPASSSCFLILAASS